MIKIRQSGHRRLLPRAIAAGLLVALTGAILPTTLLAAEIIGLAESVTNRVTGDIAGIRRELAPDADVHRNEIIRTEAQSATRLRFADRSDLRLGPQAQIRLDAFVFSGNAGSAMNLSRGALRFVWQWPHRKLPDQDAGRDHRASRHRRRCRVAIGAGLCDAAGGGGTRLRGGRPMH